MHDLGQVQVKHGIRIPVVNLYTDQLGNSVPPTKLRKARAAFRIKSATIAASLLIAVIGLGFWTLRPSQEKSISPLEAIESKSIAVLPFENLSEEKANAYFADGIQEEILTRLASIAELKVISRSSTQLYRSKPRNLREIAKRIAESLQGKLTGRGAQALAVKPINNPDAYYAYLRGLASEARSYSYSLPSASSEAAGFYERAVQLDPKFALAWARLSRANANLYFGGLETTLGARRDAAKHALENAQNLAPDSTETLLALGYYQY